MPMITLKIMKFEGSSKTNILWAKHFFFKYLKHFLLNIFSLSIEGYNSQENCLMVKTDLKNVSDEYIR